MVFRVHMECRDGDNVVERAARRSQNSSQIVEGELTLRSEIWLRVAILATADLTG